MGLGDPSLTYQSLGLGGGANCVAVPRLLTCWRDSSMGTPVRRPHCWQGDPPSCGDGGHEQDGWSYIIHSLPSANLQGSTESRQEPPTASPTGKPRQPSQGQRFTVHFGWHGLFKVAVSGLGGRQADALICHVGVHVAVLSRDSLGLWAVGAVGAY